MGSKTCDALSCPRLRELERVLPSEEEVVDADDENGLNLAETSLHRDIDYTAESGPALGLVVNSAKCVVRRIITISASFGPANRASLHVNLPPPPRPPTSHSEWLSS